MSTYTPISSFTATTSVSSVTIAGIPQNYTDLVVISDCSVGSGTLYFAYQIGNGSVDTGNNYSYTYLLGSGSAASSGRVSSTNAIEPFTNTGTNNRLNVITSFQNYANTTTYKTALTRHNSPSDTRAVAASVALWRSTSAINTIKIYSIDGNNFNTGSTFNLYGIDAQASAQAKATGGSSIYTDGTYWYHIFNQSGFFIPSENISNVDYLVVAGGGSPTNSVAEQSGGGGAGGLRSTVGSTGGGGSLESKISFSKDTNYTVLVGAGGGFTTNGSDSSIYGTGISTITSIGGGSGGFRLNAGANGQTGGSGGGGGDYSGVAGSGTANQGFAGGNGGADGAGGGGGAGGAGSAGTTTGGARGAGLSINITGSSITYAQGGIGGGGTTGSSSSINTGKGGDSGETTSYVGSSGVVVLRYAV